ncbi:MAG TPA: methyltransferase domain-containing protein [Methylococcaceae bacterium]|nr:methyltransferase domain-containing protein [Methylococcaceae bacterium]
MTGAGVDKRWVGASFGRAAPRYDRFATMQRRSGEELLGELCRNAAAPATVIDLGAGTGFFLPALREMAGDAPLIAVDLSETMLHLARQRVVDVRPVAGDAENLPLADNLADVVFANLALQWCNDLPRAFAECRRVLRPGGHFAFTLFGPATLGELRRAWGEVDAYTHVSDFPAAARIRALLSEAGLSPVLWRERTERIGYPDVPAVLEELRGLGARNLTRNRPRHLMGKTRLERLHAAYRRQCGGEAFARFEIFTVVARAE